MIHLGVVLICRECSAVTGIVLIGGGRFNRSVLNLLDLCQFSNTKSTAFELHRNLFTLTAGHSRLFLSGKWLTFAGDTEGLERAYFRLEK